MKRPSNCWSPAVLRLGLAALAFTAGCTQGNTLVLTVTSDDGIEQYDLYVRAESTRAIVEHTGWQDATRMKTAGSIKIGVDLAKPGPGDYTIVLVGRKGSVECSPFDRADRDGGTGPDGGTGGAGSQSFFAVRQRLQDNVELAAKLRHVPAGDDGDHDCFPDAVAWIGHVPDAMAISATLLDCTDTDSTINPFAVEPCWNSSDPAARHLDVDCDGVKAAACIDSDGDGDPDVSDCKKDDPTIHHPNHGDPYPQSANCCGYNLGKQGAEAYTSFAAPLCHPGSCGDGIDQDCSGHDIPCARDNDCDTFLAADNMTGCAQPANVPPGNDCNDCDPSIHPMANEICDGKDNNCNGLVDETCVQCDIDGDSFQRSDPNGNPKCPDAAYITSGKPVDCDDDDRGIFPGATAIAVDIPRLKSNNDGSDRCNVMQASGSVACSIRRYCAGSGGMAVKADCGVTVNGCPDPTCDSDGDGFVDKSKAGDAKCDPGGKLSPFYDCNDKDPTIFLGAPEKCGDGIDQDCDGKDTLCSSGIDADGDGYLQADDCDESMTTGPARHPWGVEICDGLDNDCDGLVDEDNPDRSGMPMGKVSTMNPKACNDSGIGECKVASLGRIPHCVCSSVSIASLNFDDATRMACPDELNAPEIDVGNKSTQPAGRCYFATQRVDEICNGKNDHCDNNESDFANMGAAAAPYCGTVMKGSTCCDMGTGGAIGCRDLTTDANLGDLPAIHNCNGCNTDCGPLAQAVPMCMASTCQVKSCLANHKDCDKKVANGCEVDITSDALNCSDCGVACAMAHIAKPTCNAGVCDGTCDAGFADCDKDKKTTGCEVATFTVTNCGPGGAANGGQGAAAGCGNVCSTQNAASNSCPAGACQIVCKAGFANCNDVVGNSGVNSDGCEVNTLGDVNNCGAGGGSDHNAPGCKVVCAGNAAHVTAACNAGVCSGACAAGFADCDGNKQANGCEDNVVTDANNCGAGGATGPMEGGGQGQQGAGCGTVCSNAHMTTRTCGNGICNGNCAAGFADCNGDKLGDGCEHNVTTDPNNCGAGGAGGPMEGGGRGLQGAGCGVACSAQNVTMRVCAAGSCDNGVCAVGFADCNNDKQSDGCEVNTFTPANCGPGGATNNGRGAAAGCGNVCSSQNAMSNSCPAGGCAILCKPGFANCNDKVGNNGANSDGCEVTTLTDVNNCGAGGGIDHNAPGCAVVCPGAAKHIVAASCAGGVCNGVCTAGFADCNGDKQADGCEDSVLTDVNNCGAGGATGPMEGGGQGQQGAGCGVACPGNASHVTASCAAGVCNGVCAAGYADCNNNKQSDGCEDNVANDPANCGVGGATGPMEGGGRGQQGLGCGTVCPGNAQHVAAPGCGAGICNGTCAAGFADCNGNKLSDGCEVNVLTDKNNCGAGGATGPMEGGGQGQQGAGCGVVCDPNITNKCAGGICMCGNSPACGAGQRCSGGMCVCDGTSCPGGCCNGTTCVSPATGAQCGAAGAACVSCVANNAGHTCVAGVCGCVLAADCPTTPAFASCDGITSTCQSACGVFTQSPCNGGCCNAGMCAAGTADAICGGGGAASCTDCTLAAMACVMQACQ